MLMLVLTWIGAVLGITVLLLMALGPVIVELDSFFAQRRRERKHAAVRTTVTAVTAPKVTPRPVLHG